MKSIFSLFDFFVNFEKYSDILEKSLKLHSFILDWTLGHSELDKKVVRFNINHLKNLNNIVDGYSKLTGLSSEILIKEIEKNLNKKEDILIKYKKLPLTARIVLIRDTLNTTSKEDLKKNSILEIILEDKIKNYSKAYNLSFFSIIASCIFYNYLDVGFISIIFFVFLTLMTFINQKCLEYRIFKGYYGNNASEVKEFIKYINMHSDKNDFNGSNGLKDIFPKPIEEKTVVYGEGSLV